MNSMVESIKKNKWGILLMVFASFNTAIGQMFWKMSDGQINLFLLLGFVFYFFGAVFMFVSFRFGSLSVLHPFMSVGYIFGIIFGLVFLNEVVTFKILVGIIIIMVGVMLIGGGDHD